jgi:hypothetical protein
MPDDNLSAAHTSADAADARLGHKGDRPVPEASLHTAPNHADQSNQANQSTTHSKHHNILIVQACPSLGIQQQLTHTLQVTLLCLHQAAIGWTRQLAT